MSSLLNLNNCKVGKTCFILGNAPSLAELNINKLINSDSFWVNGAFNLEKTFGVKFTPKYYLVSDSKFYLPNHKEINNVKAEIKFYRNGVLKCHKLLYNDREDSIINFGFRSKDWVCNGNFSKDLNNGVCRGFTVVLDAVQIAYYMGYKRILVGGVDLDYNTGSYFYDKTQRESIIPINKARKGFIFARDILRRENVALNKITLSPNLPLDYIEFSGINK